MNIFVIEPVWTATLKLMRTENIRRRFITLCSLFICISVKHWSEDCEVEFEWNPSRLSRVMIYVASCAAVMLWYDKRSRPTARPRNETTRCQQWLKCNRTRGNTVPPPLISGQRRSTDDVTWTWKVKLVTKIRLELSISKTTWARYFKFGMQLCVVNAQRAHK